MWLSLLLDLKINTQVKNIILSAVFVYVYVFEYD